MKNTPDHFLSAAESDPALAQFCDEIIEQLQAGDGVDMASLALEHPEHADQLRRLLPALEALVDLGASAAQNPSRAVSKQGTSDLAPKVLGDYRILREIGRGGMGVVYEAEQRSLNRRVALKVLPMAAALDARQFQRFQLEAQAAACLHHNNIVPVFAVGTEGGVPFYAMQYIEGRSLAQVIAELRRAEGLDPAAPEPHAKQLDDLTTTALARSLIAGGATHDRATGPGAVAETHCQPPQPAPDAKPASASIPASSPRAATGSSTHTRAYARTVAGLGLQAAEALDHAHTRGILHRDIKPGNLLLDAEGRLWVADFGLAQIQGSPSLTLSGDVLGTLRYMSPEQALARGVVIDGRTDVYSLGVTLYELLTLRPALDGKDRAEILRKIADDEPTPLRKLNASVPHDLETIIHKAMAKEPSERYATAKDLADDLRNYLEARPIRARRPSLLDRGAKWARRHTASVAAASVILVLAMIGLATSTILIAREQRRTSAALEQADARFQLARKAVDEMYTQVAEKWLTDQPGLTKLQREFLEKALTFYEQFATETDPLVQREAAQAARRVGIIRSVLGQHAEAEAALRKAIARSASLTRQHPDQPDFRLELVLGELELEALYRKTGRIGEAEQEHRQAIDVLTKLRNDFPTVGEYRQRLASAHRDLSDSSQNMGRYQEAETASRSALGLWESLVNDFPGEDQYRLGLARTNSSLGSTLDRLGRYEEARASIQQAVALLSKLNADHPSEVEYRRALAGALSRMGDDLEDTRRLVESREAYLQASQILEELAARFPDVLLHQQNLVAILINLGNVEDALGHARESDQFYQRALVVMERLAEVHPDVPDFHGECAAILHNLYLNRRARNEDEEARPLLEPAIRHELAALKLQPTHYRALGLFAWHSTDLANSFLERDDHAAASRVVEEWAHTGLAPAYSQATIVGVDRLVEVLIHCAELAQQDETLSSLDRNAIARTYFDQARAMIREAGPRLDYVTGLCGLADVLTTAPREIREPERALQLARQAVEREPANSAGWQSLAWALYRMGDWKGCIETIEKKADHDSCLILAMACWNLGNKDEARAWFYWANDWLKDSEQRWLQNWRHGLHASPTASMLKRLQAEAEELMGPIPRELEPELASRALAVELKFARRAIELKPADQGRWEAVSLAEYHNGHWDEAIRAAEKCITIQTDKGRDSPGLVLALAHARRGEMDQAREWYAKNRPPNVAWRVFGTPRWLIDEASRVFGEHEPASFEESKPTPKTGTESK